MPNQSRSMRWTLCLLLILGCPGGLLACRRQALSPQLTFVVLPRTLDNDFHASLVAGTKAAAREQDVALVIDPAPTEDDYAFQERHLQKIILQQTASRSVVQGVIIEPSHSTQLLRTLQQLDQHGIPFIVVDNPLTLPADATFAHYCGFIGTDNQRGGGLAAEYIGGTLRQGKALLIRGIMSQRTSQDREIGFLSVIKRYPDINVAHIVEGKWSAEETATALRRLTRVQLSQIRAVFAYNDLMALGAAKVFREYSLRPLIVGFDGILEAQSAIIKGEIDATVTQAPEEMGRRAVTQLRRCIAEQRFHGATELTYVTLLLATRTLTAVSSYDSQ